jgi:hypothetical protein
MPGIFSSLLHSGSTAVTEGLQGEQDRQTRLLAALKRRQDEELRQAQIQNINSQVADRTRKAAVPPAYHPTSRGEAEQFYKDTHPVKETGPVPGSDEWYAMQEHVAKIRSRYRADGGDRSDININHALTTLGQEIDDTRSDINLSDKDLKKYEDVNVTTRPTNPKRVPQFVADSTDAANLTSGRRRLQTRASQLESERDRLATEQRRRLGFRSTTITAGSSIQDETPHGATALMEPEIQAAKDQLATVFNSPDATPEDKMAAQQAYYTRRQRIAQKYGQH